MSRILKMKTEGTDLITAIGICGGCILETKDKFGEMAIASLSREETNKLGLHLIGIAKNQIHDDSIEFHPDSP